MREDLEQELNEGGWKQAEDQGDLRRSLVRATGISAAVCLSTIWLQRRRTANSLELSYSEPDPVPPRGVIRPFPVPLEATDDSDVESVRRMPIPHHLDLASSNYAASVDESVRLESEVKLKDVAVQSEGVTTVDRSCSPFPPDCFESEVDSEERFGLATGLWEFKPTSLPETTPEESLTDAIQSSQKQWMKEFSNEKELPPEEAEVIDIETLKQRNKIKSGHKLEKAATVGDTTWNSVVRYLWGTPPEPQPSVKSLRSKLDESFPSDQ